MRISRNLAIFSTGSRVALVSVLGAPSETITITNGTDTYTVSTDSSGNAGSIELKYGIYNIKGQTGLSASVYPIGRNIIVDNGTSVIKTYPDPTYYWFGLHWGTWTATSSVTASYSKSYTNTFGTSNVELSVRVRGDSGVTSYVKREVACNVTNYSYLHIRAKSGTPSNTSQKTNAYVGYLGSVGTSTMFSTNVSSTTSDTVFNINIASQTGTKYVGGSITATTVGATYVGVTESISAIWLDNSSTPATTSIAGTNSIDVLTGIYMYSSVASATTFVTAGTTSNNALFGQKTGELCVSYIPLGSFTFSGTSANITINANMYCPSETFASNGFRWAITTSTANMNSYKTTSAVTDSNQVASGIGYIEYKNGEYVTRNVVFSSANLPSNTPLYLFLWANGTGIGIAHFQKGTVKATLNYYA